MNASLEDALEFSRVAERRRAARSLLRRPLLVADPNDDAHTLVRRHETWLRQWFDLNTGWRLNVSAELARLVKTARVAVDGTSPARDERSKTPFTRRRYVLTALALAVLERADAQLTLGRLAEQVLVAAADPALAQAGVTFTMDSRDERGDLVAVVRLLLRLGVLRKVAGEEEGFLREDGDALYDIQRRVLAGLLAGRRGPSTVRADDFEARLEALVAEPVPLTEELRSRQLRWQLTRRLLDEPVLYNVDLDDDEAAYLTSQRTAITRRITELTGLVAEVRAEGTAMIDPQDDLTDVRMPETGTEGHATLLLASHLAGRSDVVPLTELRSFTRSLAQKFRGFWRATSREPGAEKELTDVAMGKLLALQLVARAGDGVVARPALARYAVAEPTIIDSTQSTTGGRR